VEGVAHRKNEAASGNLDKGQQMKESINEFLMLLAGLAPGSVAAAG
jgi:hypothetical protein